VGRKLKELKASGVIDGLSDLFILRGVPGFPSATALDAASFSARP